MTLEDAVDGVARIVLAIEAPEVTEEVMHYLDRSGRARVVGTAGDDRQLTEAVRQLEPDAVVAQPAMLGDRIGAKVVLALDTRESVGSLRAAIQAGASGYFLWPQEREELLGAAAAALRRARRAAGRGTVIAVHGGRGGAGVTFVATHLAAAFARRGSSILIEADPVFGDVAQAMGAPVGEGDERDGGVPIHTFSDAVALGDELGPDQLRGALWRHDSGAEVLLPPAPEEALRLGPEELRLVVDAAAGAAETVVVHVPRALGSMTLAGVAAASLVLEVVTLDVTSFRAASRALEAFRHRSLEARPRIVVNRAARSEISPGDVRRVFGESAVAVLPTERAARTAQDRGRLLPAGSRMGRRFDRLAAALLEPQGAEETS